MRCSKFLASQRCSYGTLAGSDTQGGAGRPAPGDRYIEYEGWPKSRYAEGAEDFGFCSEKTEHLVSTESNNTHQIVVIGGGISGLAAAHHLREIAPQQDVVLLEATDRLGGVLETTHESGFLAEGGADNFITNRTSAIDLCRRVGIENELFNTYQARRRVDVVCRGRLEPIPEGFVVMAPTRLGAMLRSGILSWPGKMRMAAERFVRSRTPDDESLASFATRRFGREMYERLVQPLVGGIYTADPDKLSVRAAMPRFVEMEATYGSLIRGAKLERDSRTSDSGARYSLFMAPRTGVSRLVEALAERLPPGTVRCNAPVERIEKVDEGRWRVFLRDPQQSSIDADAVVVAVPACAAAALLASVDRDLAGSLERIEYAPCVIVSLGFRREQIGHPLNGFGFVVPNVEGRRILSASFSSMKYPERAPEGCELIRVFIGGACQAELTELDDATLRQIAIDELSDLLAVNGPPIFERITRWPRSMPQYHVGHLNLVDHVARRVASHRGLALAGNAYRGVGIPQCIESGEWAAEEIARDMVGPEVRRD